MKEESNTSAKQILLKCEICGGYFKSITNTHLKKHNLTQTEYKKLYPGSKLISDEHKEKFSEWVFSDANRKHILKLQSIVAKSAKRKAAAKKACTTDEYRKKQSSLMSVVVRKYPDRFKTMWTSPKGKDHVHYGRSNYQRWLDKYGKIEADKRLKDWKKKNKLPGVGRNRKNEIMIMEFLDKNGIEYVYQYDEIGSFYNDFYLPEYHMVLESLGDYWHANPNMYKSTDVIKYPGGILKTAQEKWNEELDRKQIVEKLGYKYVSIFVADTTEENVLNLINNNI